MELKKRWIRLPEDEDEDEDEEGAKKLERMRRNCDFLKSILREKNARWRRAKISNASKDQINSVSEMALNLLRRNTPVSQATIAHLRKCKDVIVNLGKQALSSKKRRELLTSQEGSGFWRGMNDDTDHEPSCRRQSGWRHIHSHRF